MGKILTGLLSALLSLLVVAGTALYVAGLAPPFPWSMWAFNATLAACLALALHSGR